MNNTIKAIVNEKLSDDTGTQTQGRIEYNATHICFRIANQRVLLRIISNKYRAQVNAMNINFAGDIIAADHIKATVKEKLSDVTESLRRDYHIGYLVPLFKRDAAAKNGSSSRNTAAVSKGGDAPTTGEDVSPSSLAERIGYTEKDKMLECLQKNISDAANVLYFYERVYNNPYHDIERAIHDQRHLHQQHQRKCIYLPTTQAELDEFLQHIENVYQVVVVNMEALSKCLLLAAAAN